MSDSAPDEATVVSLVNELFNNAFGTSDAHSKLWASAPGRSEIAGNHTDHEGGHVIAGALDVAVVGVAAPNGTHTIRVVDRDFPSFEISLDSLQARADEQVSSAALVRGMAAYLAHTGRTPQGFDLATISTIPVGGGLSSSAAIESLYGRIMELLWGGRPLSAVELAQMGQQCENNYFGKPCGLMDQLSVCLGGLSYMDFHNQTAPETAQLLYDFDAQGYALVLVDVGCDHAPFTKDYAAVALEMQAVAHLLGHERLCEVQRCDFDARVGEIRTQLGDRAPVRAIHYWYENDLVDKRWRALQSNNMGAFLRATRMSGASSGMFLQNVSTSGDFQPAAAALALAEHVLDGAGALRIHGGGFGGSIQCFVPLDMLDAFTHQMNAWLGEGSCRHYHIVDTGAQAQWL